MLAHELAHVMQQAAGPVDGTPLRLSDPSDRFEREADRPADEAMTVENPQNGNVKRSSQ